MEFKEFVDRHVVTIEPLARESALAYWEAARSGSEEDFRIYSGLQLKLEKVYTSREDFEFVKKAKESRRITDAGLARMVKLLYLRYLGNQIDSMLIKRIIDLSTSVENRFSVFRATVDGRGLTTNDVYRVLRKENDSAQRCKVWEASKKVGRVVLSDLVELVGLRNEAARKIGFDNYYTMSLALTEQSEEDLERIFVELEEFTREPFLKMKMELDEALAKRFGIKPGEIRPWHYQDPYFQEAPHTDELDIDGYYQGVDTVEIAKRFYESIGMSVGDILDRSDLYEREGKNPHAFCTDIDRLGDIRILANVKDNNYWMETILHELGHGVYDKYVDPSLPYILRKYPHLCTTEASAMYFGRLSQDPAWMRTALGLDDREARNIAPRIRKHLRLKQLIFARWCQTMFHFERALYRNPDQDLNKLWWD
ncbi:MAG: M2 family metallopeptidase, partial [Candidatus Krumholzibacteria bacterium]|nr:M2 family metallopeptidase [Candidatus Krumholzibacteria bacterium]